MSETTKTKDQSAVLPLYKNIAVLSADKDKSLKLVKNRDFKFARFANALPLAAVEFVPAARSFPIGFAAEAPHAPVCFVGTEARENLFVEADGAWSQASYIPAYIRRYPFVLVKQNEAESGVLAVDKGCEFIGPKVGDLLFENGEASELLKKVADFCADFDRQWKVSLAFADALFKEDLLVQDDRVIDLPSGKKLSLNSFLQIDERRLLDIDGETFLAWRERGWLAPIYAAIASKHNWIALAQKNETL